MTASDYLLIPLVVFVLMLYPLLRKAVGLFGIYVNKYMQQTQQIVEKAGEREKNGSLQTLMSLKLLAYERVILLIERLKPDSLIPRTLTSGLKSKEYQLLLINEIRKEFEYNLSQQLYLSENSWELIVRYKDHIITIINTAAAEFDSQHTATDLARKILEYYIGSDLKAEKIVKVIKADIQ